MITPTEDGVIIDCGSLYQTWGCGCGHCLPRDHPLDRIARFTNAQRVQWGQMRPDFRPGSGSCYCGAPGRFTAGGWRCAAHPASPPVPSPEVTVAIGSYVRAHGTRPWPWRNKTRSELTFRDQS